MINGLVAALRQEIGLSSEEIADVVWLALQMKSVRQAPSRSDGGLTDFDIREKIAERLAANKSSLTSNLGHTSEQGQAPDAAIKPFDAQLTNENGFGEGLSLKLPDARSLRDQLTLAKSLRPLLRKVSAGPSAVLDEEATVSRIADEGIWIPILKPSLEPWLDLALVVDESISMHLWRRTIEELQKLLAHYGVFRDIRSWNLVTDQNNQIKIQPRAGSLNRQKVLHDPGELIDPNGRRVILIATDCVSQIWRDGSILPTLKLWASSGSMAILQMLPEWLWARTGLGFAASVQFQSLMPGDNNQQLRVQGLSPWDDIDLKAGIRVPVVTLDPQSFSSWANLVNASGGSRSLGFIFESESVASFESIAQLNQSVGGSAQDHVQLFRTVASPTARQLAGLLAATPVISLPVVRIVQDRLLPKSRQVHVAEVFLGGLLKSVTEIQPETNPDLVQYDFLQGVRDLLLESVPQTDAINILSEVSNYIARRMGLTVEEFSGVLRSQNQATSLGLEHEIRPFAIISSQILESLGGQYAEFAREIKEQFTDEIAEKSDQNEPVMVNGTMMQWFHWYTPADGSHWNRLKEEAGALAKAGFTALRLPPAFKGIGGGYDVGYGVYDLFDLGEFDQQGTVRTKYGTKDEYVSAIEACHDVKIDVYAEVVFSRKMAADFEEEFDAVPYDPGNRSRALGESQKIKSWTGFNFPGRGDKYSSMKWHWWHFIRLDYNSYEPDLKAFWVIGDKLLDKTENNLELGSFDYLMGCDIDVNHPEVIAELNYWGQWLIDLVGIDGFFIEGIGHENIDFFKEWMTHQENYVDRELFFFGERWSQTLEEIKWGIEKSDERLNFSDIPLHYNFSRASRVGLDYDMRTILEGTLMQEYPRFAITFVDDHNTQPLQALESTVESWFKPLAYAIILLRMQGYPCIFYPDYYGANYVDKGRDGNEYEIWMDSHKWIIDRFLIARQRYAYGPQYDYFDHPSVIGWTRLGNEQNPRAMAVLMSNGDVGRKWMDVGKPLTRFTDLTEHISREVYTNNDGWAEFFCNGGSVSVWIESS
ncbi:alpha-amylase [Leptolyngbya sp. CCNP1308]|uniref:alpha-amylase n=1 Tax=Leptolyngbya sp. CCNP1308 TaxID=3110255 RepID=UPI002B1FCBA0|nr:alpha-amylase [Leptolyngbya sp. CCNP1308]MEA5451786.1 alpha-amylase [Leptolyngbya sp. CCNP1308]